MDSVPEQEGHEELPANLCEAAFDELYEADRLKYEVVEYFGDEAVPYGETNAGVLAARCASGNPQVDCAAPVVGS